MNQKSSPVLDEHSVEYCVKIRGHLHHRWAERFESMEIIHETDGTTTLIGRLPDQAALYGMILKFRDMGLTLVSINQVRD